ncbi:uncharacterized protein CLUP02_05689 [Colletotrichum lupini]|uniref:Uncharacterized protein n=1 Tax=Colletotrichum lupini TaxID=145971 RepID=A0A9Q8SPI3_9PEZI|nr:uncharacterized protein CLUP02_05689 [Colletotrichum lupini]UQC80207.1 hypothetical protein CLUP02_05689 [Colletotrichum lupini]
MAKLYHQTQSFDLLGHMHTAYLLSNHTACKLMRGQTPPVFSHPTSSLLFMQSPSGHRAPIHPLSSGTCSVVWSHWVDLPDPKVFESKTSYFTSIRDPLNQEGSTYTHGVWVLCGLQRADVLLSTKMVPRAARQRRKTSHHDDYTPPAPHRSPLKRQISRISRPQLRPTEYLRAYGYLENATHCGILDLRESSEWRYASPILCISRLGATTPADRVKHHTPNPQPLVGAQRFLQFRRDYADAHNSIKASSTAWPILSTAGLRKAHSGNLSAALRFSEPNPSKPRNAGTTMLTRYLAHAGYDKLPPPTKKQRSPPFPEQELFQALPAPRSPQSNLSQNPSDLHHRHRPTCFTTKT